MATIRVLAHAVNATTLLTGPGLFLLTGICTTSAVTTLALDSWCIGLHNGCMDIEDVGQLLAKKK